MAQTRELKRRIVSIKKTRQITKTMEMVSTSKLKRASDRVHGARPYAQRLMEVIGRLMDPELRERYPLLRTPAKVNRAAIVLITSNRGLAGAFNANLIRESRKLADRLRAQGAEVEMHGVGKKGVGFKANNVTHVDGFQGAGHIVGTLRMGSDARSSVVDGNLRSHDHQNLFIMGSATFPTVACANPTLTIAALALRAVPVIRSQLTGG